MCHKQSREEGLRVCAELGFVMGYQEGYRAYPNGDDQKAITEASSLRHKSFNQMWHSKLFIKKGFCLAQKYLKVWVELCQGIVNERSLDSGISFN